MKKTKKIIMAKRIEHLVNFKLANEGNKMTTEQINKQINLQKIHNARTKRANKNIIEYDRLYKAYGGMYTEAELQTLHDLYPGLKAAYDNKPQEKEQDEIDIAKIIEQINMFVHHTQEDNYLMV